MCVCMWWGARPTLKARLSNWIRGWGSLPASGGARASPHSQAWAVGFRDEALMPACGGAREAGLNDWIRGWDYLACVWWGARPTT